MMLCSLLSLAFLSTAVAQEPTADPAPGTAPASVPRRVAIVVFSGVELLDFAGPGEVFAAAHVDGRRAFDVYTVSNREKPVVSQGFVRIVPRYTFEDCPQPDIVVLPGGSVPVSSPTLRRFLQSCAKESEIVMSVCNGALGLAGAGLLENLTVTTHHGSLLSLALQAPTATVLENRRFVDNGRIVTAAGVSAGIDGALHVVARLHGDEVARNTARYMEYEWRPDEIAALHAQPGKVVGDPRLAKLVEVLGAKGHDAALASYRELADAPPEATLNRLGYALLLREDVGGATKVFQLVTAAFPRSANACDSLSEAYERAGEQEPAVHWAERALELLEQDSALSESSRLHVREAATARVARISKGEGLGPFACPPCGMECDAKRHAAEGHCPDCGMELIRVAPDPKGGEGEGS